MALNAQMYSYKKLSSRQLTLPGDPYKDKECVRVLAKLSVFFYRDEKHTEGVVVNPPKRVIPAFKHQLIFDEETMDVDEWTNPSPKYVRKHGDSLAWLLFNREVVVIQVTPERVMVQR